MCEKLERKKIQHKSGFRSVSEEGFKLSLLPVGGRGVDELKANEKKKKGSMEKMGNFGT